MKRNFNFIILLSALFFPLASCVSTEIVEPDSPNRGNLVSLSVSAPEAYNFGSTRTDTEHKLRLVAHLYSVTKPTVSLQTVEEVATNSKEPTTIQFSIEDAGEYFVTVFADYIDKNSQPTEGHYPDKYYNTTEPGKVSVITNTTAFVTDFFNNDNRDCFAGKIVFSKGLNVVSEELKLKRPVCKVQVAAPNSDIANLVKSLEITECSHLDNYSFTLDNSDMTGTLTPNSDKSPITATNIVLANENRNITSPTADNLFFFYTFGGEVENDNRPALGNLTFKLHSLDDIVLQNDTRTIAAGVIKPAPNYKITIQGGNNWINAQPGADDITVIFNGLEDWSSPTNVSY